MDMDIKPHPQSHFSLSSPSQRALHTREPPIIFTYIYSMTIDTVELRKIQYAQELAAYTMRQWMLTRDSPDHKLPESTSGGATPAAQTTAPSSGHQTRGDITVQHAPAPTKT